MEIAILVLMLMPWVQAQTGNPTSPRQVDAAWEAMIPAIQQAIDTESTRNREFAGIDGRAIAIDETRGVTGDGVPEALVYLGAAGASTDQFTVMRIEDHRPVLAIFRARDGKVSPMIFLRGSSVMHGNSLDLLPQHHAVYASHYIYGADDKLQQCGGEVYAWNGRSKTFDYDGRLSKKLAKATCRQIPKKAA